MAAAARILSMCTFYEFDSLCDLHADSQTIRHSSCTSICLLGLVSGHVTLTMDIVCHAAAQQGAMLRIVARTTSVGKRVLSTRCEVRGVAGP